VQGPPSRASHTSLKFPRNFSLARSGALTRRGPRFLHLFTALAAKLLLGWSNPNALLARGGDRITP